MMPRQIIAELVRVGHLDMNFIFFFLKKKKKTQQPKTRYIFNSAIK